MKENTAHSLLIAKTLLERAEPLCNSGDKYIASAGMLILQDALEIVYFSLIIEISSHETKTISNFTFDQLIGELVKNNIRIPDSMTLKALNKQRVLIKHYAQTADPSNVKNLFDIAIQSLNQTIKSVIGKTISEIFISDLLDDCEAKTFLKFAELKILNKEYLESLIETRKAIFVEFENDYNIEMWKEHDANSHMSLLGTISRGGFDAPYYSKNKQWIEKNVRIPHDYIVIDIQDLNFKLLEIGVSTFEIDNLRRLTPDVYRSIESDKWSISYDIEFPSNNATESNARYCLDRAAWVIIKKQEHNRKRRRPENNRSFELPEVYIGSKVYKIPSTNSGIIHTVSNKFTYRIHRIVGGFDPTQNYYEISAESIERSGSLLGGAMEYYKGYLQMLV